MAARKQTNNDAELTELQVALKAQAEAVAVSAGAIASRGNQQLEALEMQAESYIDEFSEAASDLLINTELRAWQRTAEKLSQKMGSYSAVDALSVFGAFSIDTDEIYKRLDGIRETAALPQGKATAGF